MLLRGQINEGREAVIRCGKSARGRLEAVGTDGSFETICEGDREEGRGDKGLGPRGVEIKEVL